MRWFILVAAVFSLSNISGAEEVVAPTERDVVVSIHDAYVPGDLNRNSNVYVVASGIFPNGCYQYKEAIVEHKTDFEHEIKIIARVRQGMCLMVLVPFSKEVQLGRFKAGEHTLRFLSNDGTHFEKKLVIE